MKKCAICKQAEPAVTWQPFGPDETPLAFVRIGSHARGFPAVGVCVGCQGRIEAGEEVGFKVKGIDYHFKAGMKVPVSLALWDGGEAEGGTMICRDTPGRHEIVAVVSAPDLVDVFARAPRLARKHAALRDALDAARRELAKYDEDAARRFTAILLEHA